MLKCFANLGSTYLELKKMYSENSSRREEGNNATNCFTWNTTVKLGFLQIFLHLRPPKTNPYFLPACLHVSLHFFKLSSSVSLLAACPLAHMPPSSYAGGRHQSAVVGWDDDCADWPNCSLAEQITPEFRQTLFLQRALIWFSFLHRSHSCLLLPINMSLLLLNSLSLNQ